MYFNKPLDDLKPVGVREPTVNGACMYQEQRENRIRSIGPLRRKPWERLRLSRGAAYLDGKNLDVEEAPGIPDPANS